VKFSGLFITYLTSTTGIFVFFDSIKIFFLMKNIAPAARIKTTSIVIILLLLIFIGKIIICGEIEVKKNHLTSFRDVFTYIFGTDTYY
jgi:hypothetical protein